MVEFTHRKMRDDDARYVTKRMWPPGAKEIERIGMDSAPHAIAARLVKAADYGWTFLADGERVAVCGAQRIGDTYYTWFMATPEIANIGREFTLWLRRFCRDAVAKEGVKLEMFSASQHPNSDRWFAALGFVPGDPSDTIFRHYRYARKNKLTDNA